VSEEQGQSQPGSEAIASEVQEQALSPHHSLWPLALAVALFVILVGIMTHPVVLGVGAVLAVAAGIGWGLEKH
jgi:hypothetical protein